MERIGDVLKNQGLLESVKLQLRRPLLQLWDPLGIGENPQLVDEYDDVIMQLLSETARSPNQTHIFSLLQSVERGFGLEAAEGARTKAAQCIVDILEDATHK